jgi:major outer membrane protein
MKKSITMTLLALLSYGAVDALPVGNPSEASLFTQGVWWDCYTCNTCDPCFSWFDAWSLRVGFYGDYVFNRHMKVARHPDGSHIERTELFTNAGYLVLNIRDRLDIFGTLGYTNLWMRTNVSSFSTSSFIGEFEFSPKGSWSVGGRGTLWECDCFTIGIEGQYFQTNTRVDHFINGSDGSLTYFDDDNRARYREWQVGLGASYRFATNCPTVALVPYAAVKWARSKHDLGKFTFTDAVTTYSLSNLKSDKLWGFALGASLTLCDTAGVTVEGRFADEKAVYVNGQLRF